MRPFDCDTAGLFEGYGGLTMATREVFGGDLGWYSEIEPAACRLLEHHHEGVPNLGDITQVDWSAVPRPRRLTGGFPCQDVSSAGLRLGIRPGTRSGLWTHFAYAIDQLRPELVVIENVRGLLSAEAACDLEPCPWCLGDLEQRPLRALGAVLGDLADLGYDAQWHGRRAADDGAPHGRFRVFIAAWPAPDPGSVGRFAGTGRSVGRDATVRGEAGADADHRGGFDADTAGIRRVKGRAESAGDLGGPDVVLCGPAEHTDWGIYEPAIRRWERLLGRVAPAPTQVGKRGGQQLAPAFVEWMMGLPSGHVTAVPGLSRNEQLKLLGNGVVPQQAAAALTHMLASFEAVAA